MRWACQGGLDRIPRRPGAVLQPFYLDVDNLKPINDELGHGRGDATLVSIARALESVVRSVDTVARVGGDEFVVICEDVSGGGQGLLRDKLEGAITSIVVPGVPGGVSVSIGVATAATRGETPAALLSRANQAMYVSKRQRKLDAVGSPVQ